MLRVFEVAMKLNHFADCRDKMFTSHVSFDRYSATGPPVQRQASFNKVVVVSRVDQIAFCGRPASF